MDLMETLQTIYDMLGTKELSTSELDKLVECIDDYLKRPHMFGFWLAMKPDLEG
jgi:hypothetical protein